MDLTTDLMPGSFDTSSGVLLSKKQKAGKMTVNAFKLDEKTVVIKGFNETVDTALLKTIDLDMQNIGTDTDPVTSFGTDIVPITIDIAVGDEVTQLVDNNDDIVEYEVQSGDNLSSIAKKFNITVNTILWANDLNSKSSIKVGQKLVILPVSGVSYKVKRGDTISGLAKKFNVAEQDIIDFNKTENSKLVVGESIIIPGAKVSASATVKTGTTGKPNGSKSTQTVGQFARPIAGGVKTQGIHGHNGIDIGAPIGTSVFAAQDGVVTLTRGGDAWNGGYGNYIVIKHPGGVQTLYAHLSVISVDKGDTVSKGQNIGKSGNSGKSTGAHLHFEVRGATNPF
jgi:murein DD-endopeptidase MepM/ murein hydrolase activator NlpD